MKNEINKCVKTATLITILLAFLTIIGIASGIIYTSFTRAQDMQDAVISEVKSKGTDLSHRLEIAVEGINRDVQNIHCMLGETRETQKEILKILRRIDRTYPSEYDSVIP